MKAINIFNYQDLYDLIKSICNILIYVPNENLYYYLNKLNLPLVERLKQLTNYEYINSSNNDINSVSYDIQGKIV